jgi:hypothetical protein
MSLPTTEIEETKFYDAARLAGMNWHTLGPEDTTKAIVLTGQGLLGPTRREAGGDGGYALCQVGQYLKPRSAA